MSTTTYLCYDLRAIQAFIFKIPELKHIIGGSAIVDQFDRNEAGECAKTAGAGVTHLFSGGGKGAFACDDDAAVKRLEAELVKRAHEHGLDIRLGAHTDYSEAAHTATRLYPFVPGGHELDGHPCATSGLYPVADAKRSHRVVAKRVFDKGDLRTRHFEDRLLASELVLGPELVGRDAVFFRAVAQDEHDLDPMAQAAGHAFGGLRRWAVIAMDGNNMGRQFGLQAKELAGQDAAMQAWIREMSASLDACSKAAAIAGVEAVSEAWSKAMREGPGLDKAMIDEPDEDGGRKVVLPIRPLVVGGDDIVVLCHPRYAFEFVEAATNAWRATSESEAKQYAAAHGGAKLWPATGNVLSISAGVLFAPMTMPLHAAIPYAESLLASAKQAGREGATDDQASPEAIDWESVTESILDTPAARRQRELIFRDGDDGDRTVKLTQRPMRMEEFGELRSRAVGKAVLAELPRSIRHELLPNLRQGQDDRKLFYLRLGKHRRELVKLLDESEGPSWRTEKDGSKSTWILDAVSLLEESSRGEER